MKLKKSLIAGLLVLSTQAAHAYNVVDRFKMVDDKLKTETMLRPIGHDFIFDISAALNSDAQTFVSDISDASKAGTLTAAQNVLNKYNNTEQTIKLNLNLGIPIFSFTAWDVKVRPNFRIMADVGANLGVRKDTLTASDVLKLINVNVPAAVETKLLQIYDSKGAGQDLFGDCATDFGSPAEANAFCLANQGKYYKPDASIPNLNLFLKAEAKVGFFNQYTYGEHFFGDFNLYGMMRADAFQIVNYAMIQNGQDIELPKKANNEGTLQVDYRLGYINQNYSVALGLEEIKLATMSERDAESKELAYGYDPLIRLHAQADYKYTALSLQPFAGVHKRAGYGFADGVYAGATAGAHVWGDRLGLSLRGMVDKQYFTITPRIKLWLMQLEYSLKNPVKSTDGDVKLSAIHSIDFRLFF
jgi:hypothetical protein